MPNYAYEAVNPEGKRLKGNIRSLSKHDAVAELKSRGLLIRSVLEMESNVMDFEINFGRVVKLRDFVIFCRQFATLIRSGIQIDRCLTILEDQTQSKKLKTAIGEVLDNVRNGQSLSKSLAENTKIFPEMFINMIRAAEAAGNMDDVLDRMADHWRKNIKPFKKSSQL